MRKKSLIRRLIPWILLVGALAAIIIFVGIPLYGTQEPDNLEKPVIAFYEGTETPVIMENEKILFELDPMTTQFKLTEKETGRVWLSNPEDAAADPIALTTNKDMLFSTLMLSYTTSGGEVNMNNYTYSILNHSYDILKQEDGSIRINYSIGQIEREYVIPLAITRERYKSFTDNMKKSTKKKLESNYSLVETAKLSRREDKEEIMSLYPSVTEQDLYILKANTSTTNKEKIEGYFAEGGYTADDYEIDMQLVAGRRENTNPVFNIPLIYRLDGDELVIEIPYEDVRYRKEYPITSISVLPMFAAAGTDKEGFLFIPEGGGAIINFNNGKLTNNPYVANLYGWDYAIQRKEAVSETENAFPVFGGTHEGGSFICVIEGGSSYASINADIAGRYNSYNTVYAKYSVIHAEQYNVSAKTAQMVYVFEKEVPKDTVIQRYMFINSESYSEMANAYGDYLRSKDSKLNEARASEDIPVNVELIGAINKKVIKLGIPVDSVIPTTTFDQARKIADELSDNNIKNLNIRMTGWSNGGVRQKVLTGVHVLGELGGESGMKALIAEANQKNVRLSFDGINCFAYNSGIFDGFIAFSNAARFVTREQVHLYPYNIVTYRPAEFLDDYYLTRPGYAKDNASKLIAFLQRMNAEGIAFRDVGNLLSADYYNRDLVTREEVKKLNIETLQEAKESGRRITVKKGNDYSLEYADLITDMNLTGRAYAIVDDRIPFYQIAIHGMKDFTGDAINLSGDYTTMLLECAEYGAGLNFTFMAEDTRILQDSAYSCYTSSGYTFWKDKVISMIQRYQQEMAGLNNRRIIEHERLSTDVTTTTYEDGTTVYVNYGYTDYYQNGVKIPARDYKVERRAQ